MNDAYPPPEEPIAEPARRSPWGWIVLALLFGFLIFRGSTREPSQSAEARIVRYASRLRTALATYEAGDNPVSRVMTGEESSDAPLRKIIAETAPDRRKEPVDAAVWGAARTLQGQPVDREVLARLVSTFSEDEPMVEAMRGGKRSREASLLLAKRLEARGAISKVLAEDVRKKAGLSAGGSSDLKLFVGLAFGGLILASGVAWLVTVVLAAAGALPSLGPATEAKDGPAADGLASLAGTLFAAFYVLGLLGSLLVYLGLDSRVGQAFSSGAMLFAVPLILRRGPGMAAVGLSLQNLFRNVLIGLWAFLLELPVTAGIALISAALLKGMPPAEHPASTALMASPDVWTILLTLFGGAIVAPFWEETMFRGLLFPALRQVLRGPVPAALASSFLFASIHPQGPVLWAALASVALFSCFLAQRTRSLVPSVVMHFAHNATLLALAVLMGR